MRTVAPAHTAVKPDDLSEEQAVAQHIAQPAVANAANDTEFTQGDSSQNIATQKAYHVALTIAVSVTSVLAALLIYIYLIIR